MRKKQKGFTLVEVIVTFCLVSTISLLLFQIVLSIKDLYTSSDYKTVLLVEQGNLVRRINDDMFDMKLKGLKSCGTTKNASSAKCIIFELYDDIALDTVNKRLEIYTDKIVYDSYSMTLQNGSKVVTNKISIKSFSKDDNKMAYNSILKIEIPIENKLTEGNFGIETVIQYNRALAYENIDLTALTTSSIGEIAAD